MSLPKNHSLFRTNTKKVKQATNQSQDIDTVDGLHTVEYKGGVNQWKRIKQWCVWRWIKISSNDYIQYICLSSATNCSPLHTSFVLCLIDWPPLCSTFSGSIHRIYSLKIVSGWFDIPCVCSEMVMIHGGFTLYHGGDNNNCFIDCTLRIENNGNSIETLVSCTPEENECFTYSKCVEFSK